MTMTPTLEVQDLRVTFPVKHGEPVKAVDGVSLTIPPNETLGLVGESGCGKTTLSRAILGLISFEGEVFLDGTPLDWKQDEKRLRKQVQLIFQDPFASLNPRMTVDQCLQEPLWVHERCPREERVIRVNQLLDQVGLTQAAKGKYPHEFSGGQRQRVAIARALILEPEFVIADEPVSALDVSIQAQILNLLQDLREQMGLTMLFISHDLAVVRHVAGCVAVMNKGQIVEQGPCAKVLETPEHPYTQTLLDAAF